MNYAHRIKKIIPFFSLFCFMQLFQANIALAVEPIEGESNKDLGIAAVWIMSEVTQGGYLKPALNLTVFDSDPSFMWEFEGGWRFTNWFKLGASLKRTFTKVDRVNSHITTFGFVAGASGRNPSLGDFTLDLNVGSFDTGDIDKANYYVEPGFHVKQHLFKRMYWTLGVTYRYVEDESVALLGKNSFNSLSLKLALVNFKY